MSTLHLALIVVATLVSGAASAASPIIAAEPTVPTLSDKTLVAWVTIANQVQRGGSALTIECGDHFDAVVFGERKPGAWMAGSEMFYRTQEDQSATPIETAGPREVVRMASVYCGNRVTIYRNDAVIASYRMRSRPTTFGDGSTVLIGVRHQARIGQPDSYFAGEVEEARIYPEDLSADQIAQLRPNHTGQPKPLARWTFQSGKARDLEGTFPEGVLHGGAVIRNDRLVLNGKDAFMSTPGGRVWRSSYHYRPVVGNVADPIPFYWKGEYHVFYLQGDHGLVPWRHIVSRDLVHWKELPSALVADGAPDGPDGCHMFTGSVTEYAGTFHIFYTGHNPANPAALEVVRHATSRDLIHWTKDPSFTLGPDGVHYAAKRFRNWRDPYVFWNAEAKQWWMVVIGTDPAVPGGPNEFGRAVQGLLVSDDLRTWTAQPPIPGGLGEECPDLFRIGDTWYLIGGGRYVSGPAVGGPFTMPAHHVIDLPGVYAGKRMFDGKRHIWVGWAWDGPNTTDAAVASEGVLSWGGFLCLPRELYPGPGGELLCRPAAEIVALHDRTVLDAGPGAEGPIDMPSDCMVECTVTMDPGAEVALAVREQADGRSYRLIVRPAKEQIALATPASEWIRNGCTIDASKPVTLRVFLDGSIMECFVNDAYAITRRIYDLDGGKLHVSHSGGSVEVRSLQVRTVSRKVMFPRMKEYE